MTDTTHEGEYCFNDREMATVLAGLRAYQTFRKLDPHFANVDIRIGRGDFTPLTDEEIDTLVEDLNPPAEEPWEPTHIAFGSEVRLEVVGNNHVCVSSRPGDLHTFLIDEWLENVTEITS